MLNHVVHIVTGLTEHSTVTTVGTSIATRQKAVVSSAHDRHVSDREHGMSKHPDWVPTNYTSLHGIDLLELPILISVT
jgi:hypothetical protein